MPLGGPWWTDFGNKSGRRPLMAGCNKVFLVARPSRKNSMFASVFFCVATFLVEIIISNASEGLIKSIETFFSLLF